MILPHIILQQFNTTANNNGSGSENLKVRHFSELDYSWQKGGFPLGRN